MPMITIMTMMILRVSLRTLTPAELEDVPLAAPPAPPDLWAQLQQKHQKGAAGAVKERDGAQRGLRAASNDL